MNGGGEKKEGDMGKLARFWELFIIDSNFGDKLNKRLILSRILAVDSRFQTGASQSIEFCIV